MRIIGDGIYDISMGKKKIAELQNSFVNKWEGTLNYIKEIKEANHRLDHVRKILGQSRTKRKRDRAGVFVDFIGVVQAVHSVNLLMVFMEAVVLKFIGDIDQDKQETGDSDGQAKDI